MSALVITMIKVVAAMAVGFLLYKLKILNTTVNKGLSALVVNVACPCLIFSSIVTMDGSEMKNAVMLLWVCAVAYAVMSILAFLLVKLMKTSRHSSGIYQASLIFGNVGFLGLPLAESLFGSLGVFYMALMNIHLNTIMYSYGKYLIKREAKGKDKFKAMDLVNPGIIGVLLAILVFFCQIKLPEPVLAPIEFVGSLTSPLAMIIIGSSAAAYSLKKVFSQWKIYILSFVKLLIFPIAAFFILKSFWGNSVMTQVMSLYVGMPTAAYVGMTAVIYDANPEDATYATVMMNLLCIITIPVVFMIMNA